MLLLSKLAICLASKAQTKAWTTTTDFNTWITNSVKAWGRGHSRYLSHYVLIPSKDPYKLHPHPKGNEVGSRHAASLQSAAESIQLI